MAKKKKGSVADLPWVRVKDIGRGDRLVFRTVNGKLSKPDARKKLIAEIWRGKQRTTFTLNATRKGKPVPQKFTRKTLNNYLNLQKARNTEIIRVKPLTESINIDVRFTIADNIEFKAINTLNRIIYNTKRSLRSYVSLNVETVKTINDVKVRTFLSPTPRIIYTLNKSQAALELARGIIYEMYRNGLRASGIKKTPAKQTEYTKKIKVTFETSAF